MQNAFFFLLFTLLIGAVSLCAQNPPPPKAPSASDSWREYAFKTGGFALQMPGEPSPGIRGVRLLGGQKRQATFHNHAGSGFTIYTVRYADLPDEATDKTAINRIFDDIQNEKLTERNANSYAKTSQQEVSLNGHVGRLVQHELKNKTFLCLKMFVVKQRLFLLEVLFSTNESAGEMSAKRFLDSFRLLEAKEN